MANENVRDLDYRLIVTPKGTIQEVEGGDVIKQSIKTILSTVPGERVRLPDFGSRVYQVLFEPMDEDTVDELKDSIQDALEKYEDRIVVRRVRVVPDFNNYKYEIEVNYSNSLTGRRDSFRATMRAIGED